jgi:hypothetical protein
MNRRFDPASVAFLPRMPRPAESTCKRPSPCADSGEGRGIHPSKNHRP